jgi:hypothetical protein
MPVLAVATRAMGAAGGVSAAPVRTGPGVVSIGRGDDRVWIMRPQGAVRVIVVFVHGWTNQVPTDWTPWLTHLRARGALIVYPHYQSDANDTTQGALVYDYAGDARRWRVPAPVAVVGIFPAYPTGPSPSPLAPDVFAEVMVGDADTIAGTGGANTIWIWLRPHPAANTRSITIHSRAGFSATHESAQLATPIAQAIFWHPFDVLLARVRGTATP